MKWGIYKLSTQEIAFYTFKHEGLDVGIEEKGAV